MARAAHVRWSAWCDKLANTEQTILTLTVITTNIEFSKWGVVFGDDKLASALIDRIMHHGRLVEFNGTSKRMEHALMLGKAAD